MFHSTLHYYIKISSVYSHRLSHCYLCGESYNTVKLWMCVIAPQFSLTCLGTLLCYKTDVSIGHIFENICTLTNFISLLWAALDDVRASSLSVA